jgi:DNA-binding SARP family transcriptional activator
LTIVTVRDGLGTVVAGALEFRVLGPVQLLAGQRDLAGAWVRPRVLLAALLLELNGTVPVDRLAAAIWDDRAPRTMRNSLQALVSQVRRALRTAGADPSGVTLRTEPAGYALWADPGLVDLYRFRGQASAFRAAAVDDLGRARAYGSQALREWRGVALAGLAGGWAARTREALEQEHVQLLSQYFEMHLRAGRHTDVIDDLQRAVARHPLAEQLAGQLVLALFRSGREAEAVDRYAAVRRSIAQELGEEPGSALQSLYQRVLRRDPQLREPTPQNARPSMSVSHPRSAVGNQFPLGATDFTGRHALVAEIVRLLTGHHSVVAIFGKAGVGKTALALHVGHQLTRQFPDGQLFIGLGGTADRIIRPHEALARLLIMLGANRNDLPPDEAERLEQYRAWLACRRLLFVFDDAAAEAQVRPLLPAGSGSAALVTSRRALSSLESVRQISLAELPHDEAVSLLGAVAGRDRVETEPAAASQVARLCAGLPLAIRIAGARLAAKPHWRAQHLADRLADQRRRLTELQAGDLAVRASFALSYDSLDDTARQMFRALGVLGVRDFPSWIAATLVPGGTSLAPAATEEGDVAAVEEVLERLVEWQMLDPAGRDAGGRHRYRLHELLALFATERAVAEQATSEETGLGYLARGLLTVFDTVEAGYGRPRNAQSANPTAVPSATHLYPLGWLPAQQRTLAHIHGHDVRSVWEIGWSITFSMVAMTFELRSHWDTWRLTRDVAIRSADRVGDRIYQKSGRYRVQPGRTNPWAPVVAEVESARAAVEAIDEPRWHGAILVTLGALYRAQARFDPAVGVLRRAIAVFHDLGHRGWHAAALFSLASIHVINGDLKAALECYEECRRQLPDDERVLFGAYVDRAIGYAYQQHGRNEQARQVLHQALPIFTQHDDVLWHDHTLLTLGYAQLGLHNTEAAAGILTTATRAFERSGDRRGQAMALRACACVERQRGDLGAALTPLQIAKRAFVETEDAVGVAVTLADIAHTHRALDHSAMARQSMFEAEELFRGIGLPQPGPPAWG